MKHFLYWLCVPFLWLPAGTNATVWFTDSFESGLGQWTAQSPWGLTTARFASPTRSATDSPGTFYTNNTDAALALASSLNLSGAVRPALSFQHQYALESGYDFGQVEVSTNGGATWIAAPLAAYTGNLGTMSREQLDLSAFAGRTNVRLRFRLVTDSSVVMDGWYVDDVLVAEAPAPVTLAATLTNRNSIGLAWTQSAATNFAAYRLYRSLTSSVDWRTATLVAEVGNIATTNLTDITVSPKTKYFYRIAVVNADGLLTLGNEIIVTTPPGMDYPFLDNGEGGPNTWIADAPWALSDEDAASPTRAWSDSPGTNYANGIPSQALTLAAPLFLAGKAASPVLSFNHKYDFASGDSANVEISTNAGVTWQTLASYTGTATNNWSRGRISLAAWTNAAVLIRFRITTDPSANADGWRVDDISVAESPTTIAAPFLDQITSHTIRINWAASTDTSFSHYAIFRSTSAAVGINSSLVATITNRSVISFTDTNLPLDTLYYYRVYAVSSYGTFSADSPEANSARTLNHPLPFADDFEGGLINWNLTGSWGLETNNPRAGLFSLTDSPQGTYGNGTDSHALTAVNLTGSTWPVLKFWDRHRLVDNDWARVEVSTDGSGWTPVYGAYGVRSGWREQSIDLSPWKNQSNLRIRFRLITDGGGTDDGWSIDDLAVVEHAPVAVSLPFADGFETGLTNWLRSSWALDTNGPYAGSNAVRDVPGRINPDTQYWLALGGELNLMGAVNPQLVFWVKGQMQWRSRFRVQYSTDGGLTWPELTGWNNDWNADWTRVQVNLQSLTNRVVRLRFATWSEWGTAPAQSLWLDNVVIKEMPTAVTLQTPAPGLRSVSLSWTPSTLGSAFKRYEVYRSTSPNVTWDATRIGSFTNAAVTNLTDTGLSIGATYYYRVFTVDMQDLFIPSNERSATTVPVVLPLTDAFHTADQWVTTGNWGIAPDGRSGTCLSDSPAGDYGNGTDSHALTAVNLTGSTWPVLKFWDRHRLVDNDWARVEVSTDGSGWTPVYGAYGVRSGWREQSIDLSPWRNQSNLRIRFRLITDGSGTDDGWSIDDVAVVEHAPVAVSLPFADGFETGLTNWLRSSWAVDTNGPYAGSNAVRDVPGRMNPDTQYWLALGGELNLMGAVNPQLVFWVKGQLWYRSRFRVQYSTDGGLSWPELTGWNNDWNQGWTRVQVSLQGLVNQRVRLRFATWNEWGSAPAQSLWLDNVVIEEPPPPVVLNPPSDITPASMRLSWSETAIPNFKAYRVHRSETPDVTENSTLLAVITNRASTTFTDSGLLARKTYYYRVYLHNQNDTGIGSNLASAMTSGVPLPFADNFETNQPGWTFTGTWTLWPGAGRNGSAALVDSPGDYPNNAAHFAQFAVDPRGLNWPVLRFWDRHAFAPNDWGRLFVSGDGGASWTCVYGVSSLRATWAEQSIDLSPWKNSAQVWLRFQVHTDGSTQDDGWALDDLTLAEHVPAETVYPFFDGIESGPGNWLCASWTLATNSPFAGQFAMRDTVPPQIPPDAQLALVLNRELNLSNAVNPLLTFQVRGQLWNRTRFRAQASTDGGVNWSDLVGFNNDWNQSWTRLQASLSGYTNRTIRLRFIVWSEWGTAPDQDLFLDHIGIGEPAPGAPALSAPANYSIAGVSRPTLVVSNAVDFQGDPLTYRFEVYGDPGLSQMVAQVPAIASGPVTTGWPVDTDLPNNAQYWWRCCAMDGTNVGPWMTTATFFVNETNRPPMAPAIAGPPPGLILTNVDVLLLWWPSAGDPDEGDRVVSYNLQVADNPAFALPVINVTNIPAIATPPGSNWVLTLPLNSLPGAQNFVWRTQYHWRISAQDQRGLNSAWSAAWPLQYGPPAPRAGTLTGIRNLPGGQLTLEWRDAAGLVHVEFSPSLESPSWQTVAGPLGGTNWTFTPPPGHATGFYRLRSD